VSTSPAPEPPGRRLEGGERRRSRERALELCYEADAKGVSAAELLAELPVAPEPYAVELVRGLGGAAARVDELIALHATGWAIDRMPTVDRTILRLGVYELLAEPGVPIAVVIDEAIELAKEYSTEDSGRYVNGVLAAVAAAVRPAP
jgi:N utilization substance protein B